MAEWYADLINVIQLPIGICIAVGVYAWHRGDLLQRMIVGSLAVAAIWLYLIVTYFGTLFWTSSLWIILAQVPVVFLVILLASKVTYRLAYMLVAVGADARLLEEMNDAVLVSREPNEAVDAVQRVRGGKYRRLAAAMLYDAILSDPRVQKAVEQKKLKSTNVKCAES